MKVTVTGGAGFIGTALRAELGSGASVYDLAAARPRDILDEDELRREVSGRDAVVHLAAVSDVSAAAADPDRARAVNVEGTRCVARACEAGGVRALVFASSAAVYGDAGECVSEDSPPDPISEYGRTKAEGERIVLGSGVPRRAVLRIFNAYGPGGRGVVSKFVAAAASGARPVIRGDGLQTRDFVHVRDVAGSAVHALARGLSGAFNVATGESTSVVGVLRHLDGTRIGEPEYAPENPEDARRSGASVSKLAKAGFRARVSLREGIAGMLPVADQVGHAEQQDGRG